MLGNKATFDEINSNNQKINLGEFIKFVKDFNIKVSKTRASEVFKKTAKNSIDMYYENFEASLGKLFKEIANEEV